ncbi:MAG: NfeD family protein [Acidilobus sp.]
MARVGFFSRLRWGVGSTTLVIALAAVSAYLLVAGALNNDVIELFSGAVLAIVDVIIIAVKALENVTPMRPPSETLVGRRGRVVIAIRPPRSGVVRVGNELWSAVSNVEIGEGAEVLIVGREGLYVRVVPAADSANTGA